MAALVALLAVGAVAATGASNDDSKPLRKPLAKAIADSLGGQAISGVSARVTFTNRLIDGGALGGGSDPLIGGGSGRLWADDKGNVRIELQSEGGGGDLQLVATPEGAWLSHPSSGEAWTVTMPGRSHEKGKERKDGKDWPPTVRTIQRLLNEVTGGATISEATPANIAGRPAYTVRIEPKDRSGLVAGAELAWDAANGAPLRIALYAKGSGDPVLAIDATDVSFGPVSPSVFDLSPPSDAKVTDLTADLKRLSARAKAGKDREAKSWPKPTTGLAQVQAALPFTIAAPTEAGSLARSEVMLVGKGREKGAAVSYGSGLGSVIVIEMPTGKSNAPTQAPDEETALALPTVKIGDAEATVLPTALGTALSFTRDGVSYTVIGSVPRETVEAVARDL